MVTVNKPPRPLPAISPRVIPAKPSSKSYDNLAAVAALDEAEARLRAAKHITDEETKRANDEEALRLSLQQELDTLRAQAPLVPEESHKPISITPQAVTFRGQKPRGHWKITIPLALITALIPLIWTLVSDWTALKRDFKTQTDTYGAQAKRIEEINTYAHEVAQSNAELRETVAKLSGYLAGVLPKAGVKVPDVSPGGTFINVVSDPLPAGEMKKRQKPIIVHTPVPAPAPKQ
jgi:hypothetical protein